MRKTLGVALVAAAITFAGCGGNSETPRAFNEGPVEETWDTVAPIAARISQNVSNMLSRSPLLKDTAELIAALEEGTFHEDRDSRVRRWARALDGALADLVSDGGPAYRARDLITEINDLITGPLDDGTVDTVYDRAGTLTQDLDDLSENEAVRRAVTLSHRLLDAIERIAKEQKTDEALDRALASIRTIDEYVTELWSRDGLVDETKQLTRDLVAAVKDLIRP